MIRRYVLPAVVVLTLSIGHSCSKEGQAGPPQEQQKPQPFDVITVSQGPAKLLNEYPARLEGTQNIEIRPKIDGFIEEVYIDEGSMVRRGQTLFRIRNPQYEQQVRMAQAQVKSAEAAVSTAAMQVTKVKPLVDKEIISNYELQSAQLNLSAKKAALAEAQAALRNAQVNQGYTNITSPVNGIVGMLPFRTGSYISSATQQPLTTVSNVDKVYAYFSVNEKDQIEFLRNAPGATVAEKLRNTPAVSLVLADGSIYKEKGRIEALSGQVDPNTGSFTLRATFPNPSGLLRTGYSARVQMPVYLENTIVIPQKATYEMQGKVFVYVVGKDNKVKSTEVSVQEMPGGQAYAVSSGLKNGDRVVVEGVGLLRDDAEIVPRATTLKTTVDQDIEVPNP